MNVVAHRQEGYQLLHDGSIELARISANGIRIDLELLHRTRKEIDEKKKIARAELEKTDVWKLWKRRHGSKANIFSNQQVGSIFYDQLGFKAKKQTEKGQDSTDYESLASIDHPFIKPYLDLRRMIKSDQFLQGVLEETCNGFVHPVFNLHSTASYRSSGDSPNFQNNPVRDKEMARMIRSVFVSRFKNGVITENDFKGIEVVTSACYHKDRNFIRYIEDKSTDMHRDMAMQIFKLKAEEVSKDIRHAAKNRFVFPQFYGNYWKPCAHDLWEAAIKGDFKLPDGQTVLGHLKAKGIKTVGDCADDQEPRKGTFERHLWEVEKDFWGRRFAEYNAWKKKSFRDYLERGYFDLHSGFRVYGNFNRKQVCNYPIQGAAFHCLLWSLIQLNREMRRYKFRSKLIGQIHDSMIGDIRPDELSDYWQLVEEIVTIRLRKHYKWLEVPLEIEYEISPSRDVGGTWFHKREAKFSKGVFSHPDKAKDKQTKDAHKFVAALNRMHLADNKT